MKHCAEPITIDNEVLYVTYELQEGKYTHEYYDPTSLNIISVDNVTPECTSGFATPESFWEAIIDEIKRKHDIQ